MELTDTRINYLGYIMMFFGGLFAFLLITTALMSAYVNPLSHSALFLFECTLAYSTLRIMPIMGLSIMLYWGGIGYKQGYIDEYYEHHSRGEVTGSEAKKLGGMQIGFGIFVFFLSLYVGLLEVNVISNYCPEFFYHATWSQVFEKLF